MKLQNEDHFLKPALERVAKKCVEVMRNRDRARRNAKCVSFVGRIFRRRSIPNSMIDVSGETLSLHVDRKVPSF